MLSLECNSRGAELPETFLHVCLQTSSWLGASVSSMAYRTSLQERGEMLKCQNRTIALAMLFKGPCSKLQKSQEGRQASVEHDVGGGQNTGPCKEMAQQKQYMAQHSRPYRKGTGCFGRKATFSEISVGKSSFTFPHVREKWLDLCGISEVGLPISLERKQTLNTKESAGVLNTTGI